MKRELYICTKPLQYFNLKNIVKPDMDTHRTLLIKNNFRGSELFLEKLKEKETLWDEIVHTSSTKDYYKSILKAKAQTLYIDNDSSAFLALYSMFFRKTVYVYEEGFGTYRRYAIKHGVGKKKFLFYRLIGIRERIGNSIYVKGLYLYLPDLYKRLYPEYKKEIRSFDRTFISELEQNMSLLLSCSDRVDELLQHKNKSIAIYLTSHHVNNAIVDCLRSEKSEYDLVYVKPHPHIKDLTPFMSMHFEVIKSNIMVELLLLLLLNNGNKLTVYHENSTSVIWFQNRIENRNMGERIEEYNIVTSYILNEYKN